MERLQGYKYTVEETSDFLIYRDECSHAEWYELNGIDIGIENVNRAYNTLQTLSKEGLSAIVYCVKETSESFEEIERVFIKNIEEEYPSITILFTITCCIKSNTREILCEFERLAEQIKVVPTLAKEFEIESTDDTGEDKYYTKKPFGLDILSKYIFERR